MIAENKAEFFEQLQRELQKLGVEDTGELMVDLEEHFAEGERRGVPESETCRELGSIAEIARSCLDLKSTAINSMVARDVERKKGVSLTKPGRSVPADPSLAAGNTDAQTVPVEGAADLPSYTPEHVSEEIYPNAAQNTGAQVGAGVGSVGAANVSGDGSSGTGSSSGVNVTENGANSSSNASANSSSNTGTDGSPNGGANVYGGTFEKVGKAVDAALGKAGNAVNDALGKAGSAVNDALNKAGTAVGAFRPSDSYREHVNNSKNGGDIPPQYTKVKGQGGGKFVDTTGLQPNVNTGRLTLEIILDVFLWSWLIPTIFALVIAAYGVAVGLIVGGVECALGHAVFAQFIFITRVLFMLGFFNLSAAVFCLATMFIKAAIGLVKNVIARHIKAIYDI